MDNKFDLPIFYHSKEIIFPAEYVSTGYSYKINVDVFGHIVSFEPDEERNFRALVGYENISAMEHVDKLLIREIANELVSLFKD